MARNGRKNSFSKQNNQSFTKVEMNPFRFPKNGKKFSFRRRQSPFDAILNTEFAVFSDSVLQNQPAKI